MQPSDKRCRLTHLHTRKCAFMFGQSEQTHRCRPQVIKVIMFSLKACTKSATQKDARCDGGLCALLELGLVFITFIPSPAVFDP